MKVHVILLIIALLLARHATAQIIFDKPEQEKRKINNNLFGSFQASLGLISPVTVNQYIADKIDNLTKGSAYFYQGSSEIAISGSINFAVLYRLKNNFQISAPLEYTGASKTILVDCSRLHFSMGRISFGAMGSYLIPLQNETALYAGIGLLYQMMWFEKASATKLGPRVELGFTRFGHRNDIEFFMHFDSAAGINKQPNSYPYSIDFSGIYLGSRVVF